MLITVSNWLSDESLREFCLFCCHLFLMFSTSAGRQVLTATSWNILFVCAYIFSSNVIEEKYKRKLLGDMLMQNIGMVGIGQKIVREWREVRGSSSSFNMPTWIKLIQPKVVSRKYFQQQSYRSHKIYKLNLLSPHFNRQISFKSWN